MEIGTTPTHTFNIPKDIYDKIAEVKITYTQSGNAKPILEKYLSEGQCELKDGKIVTRLSQDDTFSFDPNKSFVNIQIRVLTAGNDCFKSKVMTETIGRCLDNEVLEANEYVE